MKNMLCPSCGFTFAGTPATLVPSHSYRAPGDLFEITCPGIQQLPREPSDRRKLWNGQEPPVVNEKE